MFTVYILQSDKTGHFYVGQTNDLEKRLRRHLSERTKSARNRGPWRVVYLEEFPTRSEAVRREREIKSWKSHRNVEKLVQASQRHR